MHSTLTPFQLEAIRLALVTLFQNRHFDICVINTCLEAAGRTIPHSDPIYQAMRTLHCVHYEKMGPTMRKLLLEQVVALFSQPNEPLFDLSIFGASFLGEEPTVAEAQPALPAEKTEKKSIFKALLN